MGELDERLAVLEARHENAKTQLDAMSIKVDAMYEMMVEARGQAKGAKLAIWLMGGFAGLLGGKIATLVTYFGGKM